MSYESVYILSARPSKDGGFSPGTNRLHEETRSERNFATAVRSSSGIGNRPKVVSTGSVYQIRTGMAEDASGPNRRYKVGRVLAEYGLLDLHNDLSELWLGDDGEEMSLRELADHINIAILQQAMETAGVEPLEGEAANAYRLLTDDDVSVGVSTQQRNRLDRAGVDVESLEADFVTHQAVHTYLTSVLDVSKERGGDADPIEKHEQRVQRLRSRTEAVTENSLSELTGADDFALGEYNVVVDLQVYCRGCESQFDVAELFRRGGCNCQ